MMAKLGALMKRGWIGVSGAKAEAMQPVENVTARARQGTQGQNIADPLFDKADCLGKTYKRSEQTPWPAEACRAVRELKTRVAELVEDNDILQGKCEEFQLHIPPETSAAASDLLDEARCAVNESKVLKCEFLRTVSYELRTPLHGLQGMLQVLRETNLDADQQECVLQGLSCCQKLGRTIHELLAFKAMHSGCIILAREPLDMGDILRSIEDAYGPACRQKGVELLVRKKPFAPRVLWGDADRLQEILRHLLDNALRFTSSGEIRVEATALSEIRNGRLRLCLSVHDTGIGIPEYYLERVLEPFTQVESGLNKVFHGPGLGLAIVRKLAGLMNGHVRVESMEGVYTAVHCMVTLEASSKV